MTATRSTTPDARTLAAWLEDARGRTLSLIEDLSDQQLLGPHLAIVNPLLWEIGHVAWFQEKWVLRRSGQPSLRPDADALYDSSAVAHDTRWDLLLPARARTLAYMRQVLERVLDRLHGRGPTQEEAYFPQLALFHEDMHAEAFLMTRQTLAYPAPAWFGRVGGSPVDGGQCQGDVTVPGGTCSLGAVPESGFVFDNEKWAHPVEVKPFAIARAAVTQAEFLAFVEDGGYRRPELWGEAGWKWREKQGAEHPVYWRRGDVGRWWRRQFDQWVELEPNLPVHHVNWYEAEAYCRWAGRRLPTEAEWERTAAGSGRRQRFPWGEPPPTAAQANLDGLAAGCLDVGALGDGNSSNGCRQMIGNVWEWTASDFLPYPGFVEDPYKEYSAPWFGSHKALRGGCWATRARMLRTTWRNFYKPDRRDVWAGFRTCALQP
jgi:iron(II)-dependent oxidoreductase